MTERRIPDDGGDEFTTIDIGGYLHPKFWNSPEEQKAIFESCPDFECRPDDIMLCTYPKTGTNWMYEIIMMILNKSAERVKSNKLATMMEAHPQVVIDQAPSPRLLNAHYSPRILPKDLKRKKIKTILCNRNPKDAAVSFYNHMTGMKMHDYNGKWKNWIRPYAYGEMEFGHYADFLNEWQDLLEEDPEFPLHTLYFEDLKQNGVKEVSKIAKFLDIDIDDRLINDIVHMCGFDKMKADKIENIPESDSVKGIFKEGFHIFRKGEVGDWKNWFTVAENEMFDEQWNKRIRKDTIFKFQYS